MGSPPEFEIVNPQTNYIADFEKQVAADWPAIRRATQLAQDTRAKIADQLESPKLRALGLLDPQPQDLLVARTPNADR